MSRHARIVTANRGDAGRRLDLVLCRHLSDVRACSRTRVQMWIEQGLVTIGGVTVRRAAARVAIGDVVSIGLPENADSPRESMAAEDVRLDVLYEDDQLLAVDKPAGVV